MLEREQKWAKRKKWVVNTLWIYLVILCTAFLVLGGTSEDPTRKLWFGVLAAFWLTVGGIMLIQYWIDKSRVALQEQIAEMRLQLADLQEHIEKNL